MTDRPIFAWIFAAYPIAFIATANPGQAAIGPLIWSLAAALSAATILCGLTRLLVRTWHHAALATAAATLAFFAYGPIHTVVEKSARGAIAADSALQLPLSSIHPLLSALTLLLVVGCAWALSRLADLRAVKVARALNVAACALLALVVVQAAVHANGGSSNLEELQSSAGGTPPSSAEDLPDIYYIILDGYARADVLERHYGFDNRSFLTELRNRGFSVSDASSANYYWTFLSLSSSLNFDYVHNLLKGRIDPTSRDRVATYELIRQNAAARFLRQRGYRVVHVQSTWGATRNNPYAEEQISCRSGPLSDEFFLAVAEASWLKALHARASLDLAHCHNSNFASLGALGARPGPKFVFAHFLLPHHPYLFDRNGRVLRAANLSNQFEFQNRLWESKNEYLEQLQYVNTRVLEALDRILAGSERPPLVILQSDHGPNLVANLPHHERMRVRFANFAAYHLPGAPPGLMPPDGSAVNQFRRLFNAYFGANFEIVPDRHFVSNYRQPFALREVKGVREGRPLVVRDAN